MHTANHDPPQTDDPDELRYRLEVALHDFQAVVNELAALGVPLTELLRVVIDVNNRRTLDALAAGPPAMVAVAPF